MDFLGGSNQDKFVFLLELSVMNFEHFHVNTSPVASLSAINVAPATSDNLTESLTIAQGELSGTVGGATTIFGTVLGRSNAF